MAADKIIFPEEHNNQYIAFDLPSGEDDAQVLSGRILYNGGKLLIQLEDMYVPFALSPPYKQKEEDVMKGGKHSFDISLDGYDQKGSQAYYLYALIAAVESAHREAILKNPDDWMGYDVTEAMIKNAYKTILKGSEFDMKKKKKKAADGEKTEEKKYPPRLSMKVGVYPNKTKTKLHAGGKWRTWEGEVLSGEDFYQMGIKANQDRQGLKFSGVVEVSSTWGGALGIGISAHPVQGRIKIAQAGGDWIEERTREPETKKVKVDGEENS